MSQCQELVQDGALVCRHCSHRFTDDELSAGRREFGARRGLHLPLGLIMFLLAVSWLQDGGAESLGGFFGRLG